MGSDPSNFDHTANDVLAGNVVYCPVCCEAYPPLLDFCPDDGAELIEAHVLDDRYRIVGTIAEGGMGIVYEGIQVPLQRRVAIKVMRDELCRDPDHKRRFLREAHLLTRVMHPNVVQVFDYGESDDGHIYVVMERLHGHTLESLIDSDGPLTPRRTCEIGLQVADALVAAHSEGIVHRDLKPANIVLLPELGDWVKVLDFGLAKPFGSDGFDITSVGIVVGTPLYMAPEAVRCDAPDPRTDLYALGCVLYEMLVGATPFEGTSSNVVLVRQLADTPPPLPSRIAPALRRLVISLLAKDPADRPQSALAVREALEACLGGELASNEVLTLTHAALPTVIPRASRTTPTPT